MKFGCVTHEIGRIGLLADMGFDYVELGLRALAPLQDEETFGPIRDRILEAPLPCEALSGFIPPYAGLKVVGPEADRQSLRRYVEAMIGRAAQIGSRVIVFGSGQARAVPDGFPYPRALDQLRDFLAMTADLAAPLGLTIAIEVLNLGETNLINSMSEAIGLVRSVNRPSLRNTIDYYHVLTDMQPLDQIAQAGSLLVHAHTSDVDRRPPGTGVGDQRAFLAALRAAGYDARLSIECRFQDFEREAPVALGLLRSLWADVGKPNATGGG